MQFVDCRIFTLKLFKQILNVGFVIFTTISSNFFATFYAKELHYHNTINIPRPLTPIGCLSPMSTSNLHSSSLHIRDITLIHKWKLRLSSSGDQIIHYSYGIYDPATSYRLHNMVIIVFFNPWELFIWRLLVILICYVTCII